MADQTAMAGGRGDGRSSRRWHIRPLPRRCGIAVLALLLAATAALLSLSLPGFAFDRKWSQGYIPNVTVTDREGKELKFYDDVIKGKIVVVSFIYTVCRDVCPLITARLALLQERLGDVVGKQIHFVSISIDPERDTPERLNDYARAFGAGPGWTFLTGKRDNIDLIRHKLGERSRMLTEHRNEILLGNDQTGEWARDSAFTDLVVLAANVRNMDPVWLQSHRTSQWAVETGGDDAGGEPGQVLFAKTCGSCHSVGKGDRIGPDLASLFRRRDRDWIERYIAAPEKLRAQGDPAALELAAKYRAVRMPNLGMSKHDIADLLTYLEGHPAVRSQAVQIRKD